MIPLFKVLMTREAIECAGAVMESGWVAEGPQVKAFEMAFASAIDSDLPVLALSSGTAALSLALHMAGVGPGDLVITTPQTCVATNAPIVHRGAVPVWADIDPITGCIDPSSVERILAEDIHHKRVRAIIAVDWAGRPCDYARLREAVSTTGRHIAIIQDAAHAFLAKSGGLSIAFGGGDYICWSFQAIKHLTTGDGGALLVRHDHQEGFQRAKRLRWFGLDREAKIHFRAGQDIYELGYKLHMNDIAASIGMGNLTSAKNAVDRARTNAAAYARLLAGLEPRVVVPPFDRGCSYWFFNLLVDDRASFHSFLQSKGIENSQVHVRNDRLSAFVEKRAPIRVPLPGVDSFSERQVAIPCGWWVGPFDAQRIVNTVFSWAKS